MINKQQAGHWDKGEQSTLTLNICGQRRQTYLGGEWKEVSASAGILSSYQAPCPWPPYTSHTGSWPLSHKHPKQAPASGTFHVLFHLLRVSHLSDLKGSAYTLPGVFNNHYLHDSGIFYLDLFSEIPMDRFQIFFYLLNNPLTRRLHYSTAINMVTTQQNSWFHVKKAINHLLWNHKLWIVNVWQGHKYDFILMWKNKPNSVDP